MSWPQVVIAAMLAAGFLSSVAGLVRNRDIDSGVATLFILLAIAWTATEVLVLSAGGFW